MDKLDLEVALHQGRYYRPDAKQYMNDEEYNEWKKSNNDKTKTQMRCM